MTAGQIELIRKWIEQGAEWQEHWSFIPPTRPSMPPLPDADWPKNTIDHFILARLQSAGLRPSSQTDKRTLIRRLTFDITGLPPTPEEVDAFLADESSGAWENLVDRLLESPAYGERMALNMPVQGTSSDIINAAMVTVQQRLEGDNFEAKMLLQVHDELVFETPVTEAEALATMLREVMPSALDLIVPLKIDVKTGDNWAEMGYGRV